MSTTRSSAELVDEVKNLKKIVEKLVDENKGLREQVSESIKSAKFFSDKFDDDKKIIDEVLKKLTEITNQNNILMERNSFLENKFYFKRKNVLKWRNVSTKLLLL